VLSSWWNRASDESRRGSGRVPVAHQVVGVPGRKRSCIRSASSARITPDFFQALGCRWCRKFPSGSRMGGRIRRRVVMITVRWRDSSAATSINWDADGVVNARTGADIRARWKGWARRRRGEGIRDRRKDSPAQIVKKRIRVRIRGSVGCARPDGFRGVIAGCVAW